MKKVNHWWWEGSDLAPMFQRVAQLGSDNVTVQFDPHTKLVSVIPLGDAEAVKARGGITTYNYAHICPGDPRCPPNGD